VFLVISLSTQSGNFWIHSRMTDDFSFKQYFYTTHIVPVFKHEPRRHMGRWGEMANSHPRH